MTREIKIDASGNTYLCKAPPYRLVLDIVHWAAVRADKTETVEMRNLAIVSYGLLEDDILEVALSDADRARLDETPMDASAIVLALLSQLVSKKKSG